MQNIFSKFKSSFSDSIAYLKTQPLMTSLLIVVVLIYGGLMFAHHGKPPKEPSKAMQQMQLAEEKLKEKGEANALKEFILKKAGPFEIFLLVLVPLILFIASISGIFLDAYLAGKIRQRKVIISSVVPDSRSVPWGVGEVAKSVIYVLFTGIILSLVLGLAQGFIFGNDETYSNFFLLLHTVLLDLFILFFVCFLVERNWGVDLKALGLRFIRFGKDVWLGMTGYVAVLPLVICALLILVGVAALFSYEPPPHPLVEVFVEEDYRHPGLIYFSIFLACTIGPIIEEIFFRGFCYPAFKKKWGTKWGMVLSAAFFAGIHNSLFAFFPIFVLGLAFAYVYEKRGSLVPSIVMHILHNSIFIGYFFLLKRSVLDQLIQS